MPIADVALDDKYTAQSGRVFLSGLQALVRLPMMQRERDRAEGLTTGGFISGYRGSPLGRYDDALWKARPFLERHDIHFQPGINEDLAATSIWGSQQVNVFPGASVDGVFAIWYGKGPGVDRSTDVLKHGNAAGSAKQGGVLVVVGDDHGCQSSTLPHQSEQVLAAAMIPILNPASVQDYLDFGLYGFALSRFSGCWVGFKAIAEAVESMATVDVARERVMLVRPEFEMPAGGLNLRWPDPPLSQERRLHGPKMAAVAAFARANPIDRIVLDAPAPRLGLLTTGKAYLDVRQALDDLGIDAAHARALGIRLYKLGLSWPLETEGAQRFAAGLDVVLVVEEKRAFVEDQLVHALYGMDARRRPRIYGKRDERGRPLLPSEGELTPVVVAEAIVRALSACGAAQPQLEARLKRLQSFEGDAADASVRIERTPFFCPGCPHNTSTRLPEGSRALAGIGCHGMAMLMPARRTTFGTHMGGEGATWIGQAPFTSEAHVFVNLGDGTYQHSGLLAIRAAAAAGVNVTYKILYNDAVAMTGGQPVDGLPGVADIARQVAAEGAKKVVVVADDVDKYRGASAIAAIAEIRHRRDLDSVQRELRAIPGLTILIYDQVCAAEKRRRRKRGIEPEPPARIVINAAVCEGCGDCSEQSNCIAIQPLDTEFGRKRTIDQSSCNRDLSCVAGLCPSFVSVRGGTPRRRAGAAVDARDDGLESVPLPQLSPLAAPYGILITGIGGTGVLTIGAIVGMAAHLDGLASTVLDLTGLAQKNGAVTSHVRIAREAAELHAVRIAAGGADLLLACDAVTAAGAAALSRIARDATRVIVNRQLQPTSAFVIDNDVDTDPQAIERALVAAAGARGVDYVDGTRLATALIGDAIATNLFMLGYAYQRGLVPVSLVALVRAIELNGVAIDDSKRSFAWGRLAAHDPARVAAIVPTVPRAETPDHTAFIARRASFLAAYQDDAYARRYRDAVAAVAAAELAASDARSGLTEAVAAGLFKLMAYKDEYEVARLYTDGTFAAALREQFDGELQLAFHLAPPLFARRDPQTGRPLKRAYGPWMRHVFALLARCRRVRGTPWDPFGRTAERRMERRLIEEYVAVVREISSSLTPDNHALAIEIARLPERIRGFGVVKERSAAAAKSLEKDLLARFHEARRASLARGGATPTREALHDMQGPL